ncbi:hypothetical protein CDD82_6787 [Ophiocordyceps australis]|uniref:Aminotransferase class IV n=1 Tax=Ophiocordyceps australis TaxID=1399860 RepID=A0A2C5ZJK4_9HYPO|nr:hypothetical protein CDD82_6787 [Ophiocordyceps australis]
MAASSTFSIITSIRYDPSLMQVPLLPGFEHAGWNYFNKSSFYMLDLHRDRLLRAASHWNWQAAIHLLSGDAGLEALSRMAQAYLMTTNANPNQPKRLRVIVSSLGTVSFAQFDTPVIPLKNLFPQCLPSPASSPIHDESPASPCFTLVVDTCHTDRSEFTHYKTTIRNMYNDARQRVGIQQADLKEVLIINAQDQTVIEASLTTPYFWRQGKWVTPPTVGPTEKPGCPTVRADKLFG